MRVCSALLTLILVVALTNGTGVSGAELSATDILDRMIDQSRLTSENKQSRWHSCRRITTVEELEASGGVASRKSREQRMVSSNGVETLRLIKVNGEPVKVSGKKKSGGKDPESEGDEDWKKEPDQKERPRKDREGSKKGKNGRGEIDEALLRRFNYQRSGEEIIEGRTNYVLSFSPKPVGSDADMMSRMVSLLNGRIWVDSTAFELTRVDAHLLKSFDILGGIAASIQRLNFAIERMPLKEGVWETRSMRTELQGRKFLSSMRMRILMDQDEFETVQSPKIAQ